MVMVPRQALPGNKGKITQPPGSVAPTVFPYGVPAVKPQPVVTWTWVDTMLNDSVLAGGNRVSVYPGLRAEVVDNGKMYHVYIIAGSAQRFPAFSQGNKACAEERIKKEGGPEKWCNSATVASPCVNTYQDGGEATFLVLVHQPTFKKSTPKLTTGPLPDEPLAACECGRGSDYPIHADYCPLHRK